MAGMLLGLFTRNGLTEFQQTFFRAGHAHAGVLLLLSLLYHYYMEQTTLSPSIKVVAAGNLDGYSGAVRRIFVHMAVSQPVESSLGTTITSVGAVLLAAAIAILVYGLITSR